jgi:hypothetical protein
MSRFDQEDPEHQFFLVSKFNLSTGAFVFPSRNLGPYINTIKKSNSHTIGHLCFNVAAEKEGTLVNNLVPHNRPCRYRRAIGDESISCLRFSTWNSSGCSA